MEKASEEHVGRPLGENISYGTGEVTSPYLKALALVNNISGIHSDGWEQFMVPRRLLRKAGRKPGQGSCNLTETVGHLTSVEVIWLGLVLVETDDSAGSGDASTGRDYWPKTDVCWRYLVQD